MNPPPGIVDRNDLAYWFPPIERLGLWVPETKIVKYEGNDDLIRCLDGEKPDGFDALLDGLVHAADELAAWPCFLRSGHLSGKHNWDACCYVEDAVALPSHVVRIIEESHMPIPSLPTDTWVVRKIVPTTPLFRCETFGGLPVTREFRVFVRDKEVEHIQPYWPQASLEDARPDNPDWRALLKKAAELTPRDRSIIETDARQAVSALGGGFWSVDFLRGVNDKWWLIDMAEGDRSFRYEP